MRSTHQQIPDDDEKMMTINVSPNIKMALLKQNGVALKRVSLISDKEDDIVDEIRRQVSACDVVITSGGLGPTHDDVTLYAVARALGQRMVQNPDLISLIREKKKRRRLAEASQQADRSAATSSTAAPTPTQKMKEGGGGGSQQPEEEEDTLEIELSEAEKRMAVLPENSQLRIPSNGGPETWPILQCGRVFVLPGVPQFFEEKLGIICENFLNKSKEKKYLRKIHLSADEVDIVHFLDQVVAQFSELDFGSYPFFEEDAVVKTVITVEGSSEDSVKTAAAELVRMVGDDVVLGIDDRDGTLSAA